MHFKNCEKCMQSLPATYSRMYKVDKSGNILVTWYLRLVPSDFGIIEGLVTSLCQASKLHLPIKGLTEQLLSNINFNLKD